MTHPAIQACYAQLSQLLQVQPLIGRSVASQLAVHLAYQDSIEPRFVNWLSQTWQRCPYQSYARHVLGENDACERAQDHPWLLHRCSKSLRAQASSETLQEAEQRHQTARPHLETISQICDHGSLVDAVFIIAALEQTSNLFIPELRASAVSLGTTDTEYWDIHGAADQQHANEAGQALLEIIGQEGVVPSQQSQTAVIGFLRAIFG